ncbi:MAG TPA: DNA polymerase IV, partial [Acidimicrobiia bacterium]
IAAKSISVEETYESDLATLDLVETALLAHAQRLSDRLRRSGLRARTVTLKVRWQDFTTITRSETTAPAVDGARDLYRIARELMADVGVPGSVRLLGLSGTSLEPAGNPAQMGLSTDGGWVRVEDAVADIRARDGVGAVGPARLVDPDPPARPSKNPDA